MGATSYREQHALKLHRQMQGMPVMDPTNHLQRLQVQKSDRSTAAKFLEQLKRECSPAARSGGAQDPELMHITCWHNTPALYRKHIAHMAGLPAEVVGKMDRDLTEREKAMLRAAIRDFLGYCNSLIHL